MKFICSKSDLSTGLQIVSRAVPSKTTNSIQQSVLIDTTQGTIKFISNDTELGIETLIEGTIEERGFVAVEAKLFDSIVRKLPDNTVTITTDENFIVSIQCEKIRLNIPGRSGEDFTYLPSIEKIDGVEISQMTLKKMITKTIFSVSANDSDKMMTGELIEVKGDDIKCTALDRHRIAIRKEKLSASYGNKKVIVPGKTLNEIGRIISDSADKFVKIYFTDMHILFEFDSTLVVSRLIEGEYFDIDRIVSSDYETKISIRRKDLVECVDRATLLVKEGDKKPIILNITDDGVELKINSTLGSMDEVMDAQKQGKDIMIGFNPRLLLDSLRVIEDEVIHIYFVIPRVPCYIRDDKESYLYSVFPVNFKTVE